MAEILMGLQVWDSRWFLWLNHNLQNPFFDWVMPKLTELGSGGFVWLFLAFILAMFGKGRGRKMAFLGILAMLMAWFFSDEVLKNLVARPRPFLTLADARVLVEKSNQFSFPSGHTTTSFAPALAFYRKNRAVGRAALILAACIGFSRIYVGVHYPLDVLGGALLGAGVGLLVINYESAIDRSLIRAKGLAGQIKGRAH
ncbi:MAG: phosphatase PAP2 family protein [Desulfitobacteriaceae bacterium]|nr:phosphatase PAP2 family protein [Desulfitobacteriaceae bacterium]MDI6914749.1 phosphatase PAP2 family protein [Desulfitobacteriaceae bacterium]